MPPGLFSVTGHNTGRHGRMQWWHFQLVSCVAIHAIAEIEFVGIDGLWRTVKRIHQLWHLRNAGVHRVNKRPFANPLIGVG